ncbi:uncharacterized protein [Antedon mediterranea]|uniref:uncharacterized protein n=1 Tax=Antedon mediterranea TaxID=105859 RepID=UPI003AF9FA47
MAPKLDVDKLKKDLLQELTTSITETLNKAFDKLQEQISNIETRLDYLEQYSRRNNLRFYGLQDSTKSTDDLVAEVIRDKMGITFKSDDIEVSHRIGPITDKPRPIIVRFNSIRTRNNVFAAKSKLKGMPVYISEDLTKANFNLFWKVRHHDGVQRAWTNRCKIWALCKGEEKPKHIKNENDFERLIAEH